MIFVNDLSPVIVEIGQIALRWYGVLFALGLLLNYLITAWIFRREKWGGEKWDSLAVYLFIGLVVGARLGEVFFYEFDYFRQNPLDIVKIWQGGLSSHGATIGLVAAYLLWVKIHKEKFLKYADALSVAMPLTAMFVRLGNFMNSEIVGKATGGDAGVIFKKLGEDFPRHPAQLYEAGLLLAVFLILFFTYKKKNKTTPGTILFLFILLYFGGRFFIEFTKDVNSLPEWWVLNTGQVLSLIAVIGIIIGWGWRKYRA